MKNLIRRIVKEEINRLLKETDTGFAMQDGGTNPSAGTYDVPLRKKNGQTDVQRRDIYAPTQERSHDFKNGSMMCQKASSENDGTINKKHKSK